MASGQIVPVEAVMVNTTDPLTMSLRLGVYTGSRIELLLKKPEPELVQWIELYPVADALN